MGRRENDPGSDAATIADLTRRVRKLERAMTPPPSGFTYYEVDGELRFLYLPTGAIGPVIGTKVLEG